MPITCKDLLDMKVFENIKLVAGEEGLNNIISWPYIKQTESVASWIYGGELIFEVGTENVNMKEHLMELISECVRCKVAGVVILCGSEYIQDIPPYVMESAKRHRIPLFKMPYNIKLIDVTKEISNAIVLGEFKKRKISNYMSELLFGDFLTEEQLLKEGYKCSIDLNKGTFFVILGTKEMTKEESYHSVIEYRNMMQYILQNIEQICMRYNTNLLSYSSGEMSVGFISTEDENIRKKIIRMIDEFIMQYYLLKEVKIYAGYSCLHHGVKHVYKGFEESKQALQFAQNTDVDTQSCQYEDMGIMKFLVKTNDKNDLIGYCNEVLKELKKIDIREGTDYIQTVYEYLKNNNNLIKTSQVLYIHRNTLINRLNKIQAVTGKDINQVKVKMEYMNVFSILEFFGLI